MVDGRYSVGDEPGQTEHGGDDHDEGYDQQVQVVPAPFTQPEVRRKKRCLGSNTEGVIQSGPNSLR